jgi:hypothetical protein
MTKRVRATLTGIKNRQSGSSEDGDLEIYGKLYGRKLIAGGTEVGTGYFWDVPSDHLVTV